MAREFSWLSPDRQDLFSPASSSINELLPYCYLHRFSTDSSQVLAALDIGDAFLTVDQQQPTIVTCELAYSRLVEDDGFSKRYLTGWEPPMEKCANFGVVSCEWPETALAKLDNWQWQ